MPTAVHVSDVHFGRPAIAEQIAAVGRMVREHPVDAIVVSGDVSQRGRSRELARGRAFLDELAVCAPTIVVPGNHDVRWWWSPLGVLGTAPIYRQYRRFIATDLEPVLRIPGATFVGLNSAQGVMPWTLTKRIRDIGVLGYVGERQIEWAREQFSRSPASDYRVLVVHHNLTKGQLSRRFGVKGPQGVLEGIAAAGVDLVLSGHDHQEALHRVDVGNRAIVLATAGTISKRSRGGRPGSLHLIALEPDGIAVRTAVWSGREFAPGDRQWYARQAGAQPPVAGPARGKDR